ncbi:ribosome biogenesis factor YjgA [Neptuniibacter halophilus]|uniref:ribosome biogenesis factor YjgA n=1 Tax=Neptuniibacter halophilus TaxID=651666 RepID=UPI002572D8C9|nr:ribosome biogenesis factor YjgA [Neptuniibacter halophilus]
MSNNEEFDSNPEGFDEHWPSKTEVKRQMHALQELGERLTRLNKDQLGKLELSDTLHNAIEEFHRIKSNGARKRHLQYIGKVMRNEDAEQIEQGIGLFEAGHQAHTQVFHRLEQWRDRLINEGNSALQAYINEHPSADVQHLRQLIRNAQKEQQQEKPPASARKLFKYLRDIAEV